MLQKVRGRLRDCFMSSRQTPRLMKLGVFIVDPSDRHHPPDGVTLAKHQIEATSMTKRTRWKNAAGLASPSQLNQPAGVGTGVLSNCCSHR